MTLAQMAESYRHSAGLLRERIKELKRAQETADPAGWACLDRRIKDLNILYRETRETARVLEHYYDRRRSHVRKTPV